MSAFNQGFHRFMILSLYQSQSWDKDDLRRKAAPPARVLPPGHLACWPAAGQTCCVCRQPSRLGPLLPACNNRNCLLLLPVWLLPTNQQPAGCTNASLWHFGLFLPLLLGLLALEAIEWVGSGWCTSNFLLSDSKSIPTDKIFSSWSCSAYSFTQHPGCPFFYGIR